MEPSPSKTIFFDLDNTLFDHESSMRLAVGALQKHYRGLEGNNIEELINHYNIALRQAYDDYLDGEITYEEADTWKVNLFFIAIGLPQLSLDDAKEFRAAYKAVYRENRRATPGSVDALVRLREHGYRTAIITNGQIKDQTEKVEAIGLLHLVDRIITSEEAGHPKPDLRIFDYAVEQLGAAIHTTHMVGDDADSDVKGSINAELVPILYSSIAQSRRRVLFGQIVPVINHMSQVLTLVGIDSCEFNTHFISSPGQLVIRNLGLDMATEPRPGIRASKEIMHLLAEKLGTTLVCLAEKRYIPAMCHIEVVIRAIANLSRYMNESGIQISFPRHQELE